MLQLLLIFSSLDGRAPVLGTVRASTALNVVYYSETNRELKRILIDECQGDERLNAKAVESIRLAYSGTLSV